jgi:opacity protein-like surface antigen
MRSQQDVTWFPGGAGRVFDHDKSSWIWSAHVGAQMQFGSWVVGIEGSDIFRFGARVIGAPSSGCPNPTFTCQAALEHLWTVGARLGVAVANTWLPYVTGGYAGGRVRTRSFATATGVVFDDLSKDDSGWFVGGGLEHAIPLNANVALVFGVEYKHIDLGSARFLSISGVVDTETRDIKSTADVVVGRMSVKFY